MAGDHAAASVKTVRAELAELRPRLEVAERKSADADKLNGILDAALRKTGDDLTFARALVRELYDLNAGSLSYRMGNETRVLELARDYLKREGGGS